MKYELEVKNGAIKESTYVTCGLSVEDGTNVCECKVYFNKQESTLVISSWFTKKEFTNQGLGKATMKHIIGYCINEYGMPTSVKYIWNGTNHYVLEWLQNHFDAVCCCPIAVQKNNADDDWSSHIYELNRDKVLEYFGLLTENREEN